MGTDSCCRVQVPEYVVRGAGTAAPTCSCSVTHSTKHRSRSVDHWPGLQVASAILSDNSIRHRRHHSMVCQSEEPSLYDSVLVRAVQDPPGYVLLSVNTLADILVPGGPRVSIHCRCSTRMIHPKPLPVAGNGAVASSGWRPSDAL
ncbi:hypothetical protein C8T65DRAFT_637642 [Cerioporus squamosus]|nr:hypothetical protein C8T65DRAFT_637642 [Cerioporus squamosus]